MMQDFELGLHLIANPKDKLHRGILLKRWRNSSKNIPLENVTSGLELIKALRNSVSDRDQQAVVEALEKMDWTEHEFKFLKALNYLDNFSKDNGDPEERALIMEDIEVWRKHWDYYLKILSLEEVIVLFSFWGM